MTKPSVGTTIHDTDLDIDLKNPRLAAFLAWLVPGLGHLYQGRTGKGILFFVCIVGTFVYGMYIGGGRVVYASTENIASRRFLNERWQYVCQLGVGLPALPALIQRERVRNGKPPLLESVLGSWSMRPPYKAGAGRAFESLDTSANERIIRHHDESAQWNYELSDAFEIGTVFTVIAGLLNILAIFDAYGGPLILPPENNSKSPDKPGDAETNS